MSVYGDLNRYLADQAREEDDANACEMAADEMLDDPRELAEYLGGYLGEAPAAVLAEFVVNALRTVRCARTIAENDRLPINAQRSAESIATLRESLTREGMRATAAMHALAPKVEEALCEGALHVNEAMLRPTSFASIMVERERDNYDGGEE